jgi:predicted unusual protein kinase regulating ubiquinone biosynthesis (AarF/ABC1/UbiB family)
MQVPPFGAEAVRFTLERAFGKPVEELFEEFDFTPLAAASLGQVHLAKLNGKRVVVKVQRPGLRELFAVDLKNVRVIAQWLQVLTPLQHGFTSFL